MNDTITITGNVATDPDHKRTAAGVTITTFRVASAQRRFDRSANAWVDSATNWYSVSAFRSLADHAFHSLRKGDRVLLTGRLRIRDWDNGTKRGTAVEVEAEAIGHDLLWGTTTFAKDGGAAAERHETEQPPERGADEWAAPGTAPDESSEWSTAGESSGEDGARPLQLVGAEPPF